MGEGGGSHLINWDIILKTLEVRVGNREFEIKNGALYGCGVFIQAPNALWKC